MGRIKVICSLKLKEFNDILKKLGKETKLMSGEYFSENLAKSHKI